MNQVVSKRGAAVGFKHLKNCELKALRRRHVPPFLNRYSGTRYIMECWM